MQITDVSNTSINWDDIPITKNSGERGNAYQRTVELGNVRLRIVEYSPGYKADHCCCRGHVIYVLEGEIVSELKEGGDFILKKLMNWVILMKQTKYLANPKQHLKSGFIPSN